MTPLPETQFSAVDPSLLEFENSANDTAWLVSYLDIFILTAALFATLLAFEKNQSVSGQLDPPAQQISKGAEDVALTNTTSEAGTIGDIVSLKTPTPLIKNHWQNSTVLAMQRYAFNDDIQIEVNKGYAEMSVGSALLFANSEANLLDHGTLLLRDLVNFLKETQGLIVIQGHTDSSPINSTRYLTNWDLASARANNVLHFLLANGLERSRLRAISFADTKPVSPNDTEAHRQQNRRVNIMLISPEMSDNDLLQL